MGCQLFNALRATRQTSLQQQLGDLRSALVEPICVSYVTYPIVPYSHTVFLGNPVWVLRCYSMGSRVSLDAPSTSLNFGSLASLPFEVWIKVVVCGVQTVRILGASWASRSMNGLGLIWLRSRVD